MLRGSPWVYMYSHQMMCHQMITRPWPKGPWGLSGVTQRS